VAQSCGLDREAGSGRAWGATRVWAVSTVPSRE
jgi:hypothetical protein